MEKTLKLIFVRLVLILIICNFLTAKPIDVIIKSNRYNKTFIENLNLIGNWNIEAKPNYINFMLTVGSKWNVTFKKYNQILLDNMERDMFWWYDNKKGIISIFNKKIITIYGGDEIILGEYIGNQCFNAILNKNYRIKACKTNGNILINPRDYIKIE